jgi:hypothetical protein
MRLAGAGAEFGIADICGSAIDLSGGGSCAEKQSKSSSGERTHEAPP